MKNKTIVILMGSEGKYDSYIEFVESVYIVPRKNFKLSLEYTKYFFKILKEKTQAPVQLFNRDDIGLGIKYGKMSRKLSKEVENLAKIYTMKHFIETVMKGEKITNYQVD